MRLVPFPCCLLLAASACATVVDVPPSDRVPVVEGLLLADSASAVVRVVWQAPSDLGAAAEPVPASRVELTLEGPAGAARFVAVADSPGFHRAALAVARGAAYRLAGRVAGRAVAAAAVVPGRFDVAQPDEPLVLAAGAAARPPFRWSAAGARAFYAAGARFAADIAVRTRDTAGLLLVEPPGPGPVTTRLLLFAIGAEADGWFFDPGGPRGNVTGAAGFLGGAIQVTRTVRWQP